MSALDRESPAPSFDAVREKLILLCERVLRAEASLHEVYAVQELSAVDPFFKVVADDLEDAVEHTPGIGFSGEVNKIEWIDSEGYLTAYLDLALLRRHTSTRASSATRERILRSFRHEPLSRHRIDLELRDPK